MIFRALLFSALIFMVSAASAQDIHYSMFDMSPLTLNPSNTGNFEGTFRIGGIYRDQWASVITNPYRTPGFYIDAPIIGLGKNSKSWIGIGGTVFSDQAGQLALSNTTGALSVAGHFGLGKSGNTRISVGLQGGFVQNRINLGDAKVESNYTGGGSFTPGLPGVSNNNVSFPDFNAGLSLFQSFGKALNFTLGFAANHILQPKENFGGGLFQLPTRLTGHAEANIGLNNKWMLKPLLLYQGQATASEVALEALLGYHMNAQKDITLLFGGGYRFGDAAVARIGLNFKQFKAGVAYDLNVSPLSAVSRGNGGFEIALSYIAKIYRVPVVKERLFCPRF